MPRGSNQSLGRSGEDAAADLLRKERFRIIKRNFRMRFGEIDVIAEEGDTLCFIEVKTRRSRSAGTPAESVTPRKQRQIARVAAAYMGRYHPLGKACRFDVVTVTTQNDTMTTELLRDAFRTDDVYMV